jgi:hypothetical protein
MEPSSWHLRVRPNPLTEASWIEARLPDGVEGRLEVFDVTGRLRARTDLGRRRRGTDAGEPTYAISWSSLLPFASEVRGIHLLRLCAGTRTYSTVVVGP